MTQLDIAKIKDHYAYTKAVETYGQELMDRQVALERWSGEVGEDKFTRNAERMQADGHFHENRAGVAVVNALFEPYRDLIRENLEYKGRGARAAWKNLLDGTGHLDASDIAIIALNTVFGLIARTGKAQDQQTIGRKIMDNLKTEIISREFAAGDTQGIKQLMHHAQRRQDNIRALKRDVRAQARTRNLMTEPDGWEKSGNVMTAGVALIHLLDQAAPNSIDISDGAYESKNRRHVTVTIHADLQQQIDDGIMKIGADMFAAMPLLVPPMDWGKDNLAMGGYYTTYIRNFAMVKKSRKLYSIEIQNTRGVENVSAALNAMQRTGWKINTKVLDTMQWLFDRKADLVPGFVRADPPVKPAFTPEEWEADKKACKTVLYQYNEQERADRSTRLQTLTLLEVANKFRDENRIYFCWDMDSRGRAYPITSSLSPQGSDWNKHLLQFAQGQVIKKDSDMDGIRFVAANAMGHDKLPINDRIQWTRDNIDELVAVGRDPQGQLLWTDADSPACFLAACIELAEYADQGFGYVSRMPVAVDATCSGLQVLSAVSRDEVGGKMVNLTDSPERHDIYGAVANGPFKSRLEAVAKGDLGDYADYEQAQDFARAALEYGFDRSLLKRVVMTVPYAAKEDSCRKYVREYYYDRKRIEGSPHENFSRFTIFVAKLVWDSIPEVVVKGLEIMKWLQDVSCAAVKANPNSPLQWETADGFVGRTNRPKESTIKPTVWIYDYSQRKAANAEAAAKRVDLTTRQWLDQEDVRQHRNSCAPNWVHAQDSTHLRMVVRRWSKIVLLRGLSPEFSMIHDSFAVGTRDFREFSAVIREEFVRLYENNDPLGEYELCMREIAGPDVVFPPRPTMGNLDIRETLQSEFFFS